jgi:hypothetical protein
MIKMVDKKESKKDDWYSDFNAESLKTALEIEVLPIISVDDVGLEFAKSMKILSEPKQIKLPVDKQKFSKVAYVMEVEYLNERCQIYLTNAFRFNLALIKEKYNDIIGLTIKVWKEISDTEFGKQKMYRLSVIE